MKRLTHYQKDGKVAEPYNRFEAYDFAKKLAEYEDLEESGELRKVKRGEWIPKELGDEYHSYTNYFCSVCSRKLIGYSHPEDAPYCHCGAYMSPREEPTGAGSV